MDDFYEAETVIVFETEKGFYCGFDPKRGRDKHSIALNDAAFITKEYDVALDAIENSLRNRGMMPRRHRLNRSYFADREYYTNNDFLPDDEIDTSGPLPF